MSEFMRQHGLDFFRRQLFQQGVEEHDALGAAEAGEIGVAVRRALGAVHHEEARGGEAAAREQGFDAGFQRSVFERREFVEQRRDHRRVEEQHQQVGAEPEQPDVQPPLLAHDVHQPQHGEQQRPADQHGERGALGQVGEPQRPGQLVEAEAGLDAEGAVEAGRQADDEAEQADAGEQHQALQVAAAQPGAQRLVDQAEHAPHCQGEQHGRVDDDLDQADAQLGHRVVGGPAMVLELDASGEVGRNPVAVGDDVAPVPDVEPEAERRGRGEDDEKQQCELVWGHGQGPAVRKCAVTATGFGKLWHRIKTRSSGWTWK